MCHNFNQLELLAEIAHVPAQIKTLSVWSPNIVNSLPITTAPETPSPSNQLVLLIGTERGAMWFRWPERRRGGGDDMTLFILRQIPSTTIILLQLILFEFMMIFFNVLSLRNTQMSVYQPHSQIISC